MSFFVYVFTYHFFSLFVYIVTFFAKVYYLFNIILLSKESILTKKEEECVRCRCCNTGNNLKIRQALILALLRRLASYPLSRVAAFRVHRSHNK